MRGFPCNISATAEASDFKFGTQLGLTKVHHKIARRKKGWAWPWARGHPQNIGVSFNIYTMVEASDFKFGTQLGFAKAHHKIPHRRKSGRVPVLEKLPNILGFSFNFCTTAEASNFKFCTQLGFAKANHKNRQLEKRAWNWANEAPKYVMFPFDISATATLSS